ncbi:hypothetical protein IGS67_02925 [Flavimobilis sp. GY10621]|uniref:Htaa protein n=1 Tax=Flavimobilis rhizosphaerae TaxID=2775421 RepID=A0ABR9DMT8_9MICO|nr:hypothetical protein [Flavimobilis rhizosphaerae]
MTVIQRVTGLQGTLRWLDQSIEVPPSGSILFERGGAVTYVSREVAVESAPVAILEGDLELGPGSGTDTVGISNGPPTLMSATGCLVSLAAGMALMLLLAVLLAP